MICSLHLISLEGEQSVYFGQNGVRVSDEVLVKIEQIGVNELEFFRGDSFEHEFVVWGVEEEFPTFTPLAFSQVEHFSSILVQLEGFKNRLQSIVFEQVLEYFRRVYDHRAGKYAKFGQQSGILYKILNNLNVDLNRHLLMIVDLLGWFVEVRVGIPPVETDGILPQLSLRGLNLEDKGVEVFVFDVVVLLVGDVDAWHYSDHLWYFEDINAVVLFLDLEKHLLKVVDAFIVGVRRRIIWCQFVFDSRRLRFAELSLRKHFFQELFKSPPGILVSEDDKVNIQTLGQMQDVKNRDEWYELGLRVGLFAVQVQNQWDDWLCCPESYIAHHVHHYHLYLVPFFLAQTDRIRHVSLEVSDRKNTQNHENSSHSNDRNRDAYIRIWEADKADPTQSKDIEP